MEARVAAAGREASRSERITRVVEERRVAGGSVSVSTLLGRKLEGGCTVKICCGEAGGRREGWRAGGRARKGVMQGLGAGVTGPILHSCVPGRSEPGGSSFRCACGAPGPFRAPAARARLRNDPRSARCGTRAYLCLAIGCAWRVGNQGQGGPGAAGELRAGEEWEQILLDRLVVGRGGELHSV